MVLLSEFVSGDGRVLLDFETRLVEIRVRFEFVLDRALLTEDPDCTDPSPSVPD